MVDYVVPTGWKFYGSNNGNQTTFTLPGHTTANPRLALFDRRVPSSSPQGAVSPSYRIRIVRGISDAEGNPVQQRVVCDFTVRWPLVADSLDVIADIATIAATLSDVDMQSDMVDEQLLPR